MWITSVRSQHAWAKHTMMRTVVTFKTRFKHVPSCCVKVGLGDRSTHRLFLDVSLLIDLLINPLFNLLVNIFGDLLVGRAIPCGTSSNTLSLYILRLTVHTVRTTNATTTTAAAAAAAATTRSVVQV